MPLLHFNVANILSTLLEKVKFSRKSPNIQFYRKSFIFNSVYHSVKINGDKDTSTTHHFKVSKGAKIRNRYNQVPHLTQDTQMYQWESDKFTVGHHKREPRGQPFPRRFPQGAHKGIANTRQKKT